MNILYIPKGPIYLMCPPTYQPICLPKLPTQLLKPELPTYPLVFKIITCFDTNLFT